MKCTPMKLHHRVEYPRRQFDKYFQSRNEDIPRYCTQRHYGYSISFVRKLFEDQRTSPKLAVKTINLPENFSSYNTGSSLEKWAKKRSRLKSAQRKGLRENLDVLDENAYDISEILESLDQGDTGKEDCVSEVNSDIEELWKKSQREVETNEKRGKTHCTKHERCRKRSKHKLKKFIRFSLSKPASPNTEQIIRVEISSTVSISELNHLQKNIDDRNDHKRKETDNSSFDKEEHDFIIRCSQLVIEPKNR
ncbi:uncharacterized protein LOC114335930 [Diabrotica virgifera virgifera]|uniref:Uncharacterized protein n=1 Tax=Diabrotica virgifera virgifera TaxID=50390 RepID=A0ABM5IU58_DIAVI|nr:uncharacterized protein LOC114335930 [Diabrotica virgifera virgifera]